MSKMQSGTKVPNNSKESRNILSKLHRVGKKKVGEKSQGKKNWGAFARNPLMEARPGLGKSRRGIKSFLGRLQSTIQKQRTVGRVLQPSARIEETERLQEKTKKRLGQAAEIIRVNKHPGFAHYEKLIERIEGDSYFSLRNPGGLMKDGLSLDYTVGFYAGALSVVDDFNLVGNMAGKAIQKANAEREAQAEKGKK